MENRSHNRLLSGITMLGLIVSQITTGVFPIPIAPVESAYAAGFYITKERDDAPEDEPVAPGDTIRYKITIRNDDTKPANARIIDPLPPELEYVSATNGCSFVPASPGRGDEVICAEQPLPVGASRNVKITFRVKNNVAQCTTIENQADVWNDDANYPTGIPPSWSNVIETPTVCDNPELEITKTANKTDLEPGEQIRYTLRAENVGTGTARSAVILDQIPNGLIFDAGSSTNTCSQSGNRIECHVGDINEGASKTVNLYFNVDSTIQPSNPLCGSNIVNIGQVTAANATTNSSPSVVTPLNCPAPNLTIEKSSNVSTAQPGDTVTFILQVHNTGDATAQNVQVTDVIPNGLTFKTSGSTSSCSASNGIVTCGPANITAGSSKTYTLKFDVRNDAPCNQTVHNQGEVTANNAASAWSNQVPLTYECPQPALEITKTANKNVLQPGDQIRYTLTGKNVGAATANNVRFLDQIPNGLVFNSGASDTRCTQVSSKIECDIGTLTVNQTVSVNISFDVDPNIQAGHNLCGTNIVNIGQITAGNAVTQSSLSVVTPLHCPAPDLRVQKVARHPTRQIGEQIKFTIGIFNDGNGVAEDVTITDQVPTGLTFNSNLTTNDCSLNGGTITCGTYDIAAGGNKYVELFFNVHTNATCGGTITNTADISASNHQTVTTNPASITIECLEPQLDLQKTGPSTVIAGDTITYTFTVKNTGNGVATDVRVSDYYINANNDVLYPMPFTYLSAQGANCSLSVPDKRVLCYVGDIDPGDSITYTLTFQTPADTFCGATITNKGDAHVNQHSGPASDWAMFQVQVQCPQGEIKIIKSADKSTAEHLDIVTYTLRTTNIGTITANNVVAYDTVPAHMMYLDAQSDNRCDLHNGVIECGPETISAGDYEEYDIALKVLDTAVCNSSIPNTATANADNAPVDQSNQVNVTIECPQSSIVATKSVDKTTVEHEGILTYTINVRNDGNTTANDVTVVDPLPQNVMYLDAQSDSLCNLNSGNIECGTFDLAPGQDRDVEIVVKILNTVACGGTVSNRADVYASNAPTVWTNQVNTTVVCDEPILEISKSADVSTAQPGDSITYTLTVENTGNATANAVVISDTLPTTLMYLDAQSDALCDVAVGVIINCGPFNLNAGASRTVEIVAKILDTAPCDITIPNQGSVTANNAQPAWSNQTQVGVTCPVSSFTATKSVDVATAEIGDTVTYTINLDNTGQAELSGTWIIDTIPAGLTFDSNASDNRCFQQGGDIRCGDDAIAIGQDDNYTLVFTVNQTAQCGGRIDNEAYVVFTGNNNLDGYTNTVYTDITCPNPNFTATKTVDVTSAEVGDTVTYDIVVENTGNAELSGTWIIDTIPAGLTFDSNASDNRCFQQGGDIRCGDDAIAVGQDDNYTLAFTVNNSAICGQRIDNQAYVVFTGNGNIDGNTNTVYTDITCPNPAFTATKSVDVATAEIGDTISYDITVENTGNAELSGTWIIDTIPAGLTFDSNASDNRCFQQGGDIRCGDDAIAIGQDDNYTLVFTVNQTAQCGGRIDNEAYVVFTGNGNIDGNTNTVYTDITCPNPNFTATKTTSKNTVEIGETFHYTIDIENTGNAELTGLWIIDQIPTGLTFVDASPTDSDCFRQGNAVKCGDDPIGVGQSDSYDIYFTVNSAAVCGGYIDNIAQVLFIGNNIDGYTNNEQISVVCPEAELEVTKEANRTEAEIGDVVLYTITVENVSSTDAVDVQVYDSVIDELQFISNQSSNSCSVSGGQIICGPTDIAAGASKQFTLAFEVTNSAACDSTIYNQAEADATNAATALSNSESVDIVCPQDEADLEIHKTGAAQIMRGTTLVYDVTVTNNGPDAAQSVQITDTIPEVQVQDSSNYVDLLFNSTESSIECYKSGGVILCDGFNLASGQSRTFQIAFDVPSNAFCAKPIINDVEVWSATFDPLTGNNEDQYISTVICATSTLDIEKSTNRTTARHDDRITYTITVTNNLGFDTTRNRMIDPIPGHLEFVSADDPSCYEEHSTNEIICGEFDLDAGDSKEFELTFRVQDTAACNQNIINIADVWSYHPGVDPEWSNAVSTKILCDAVLTIQKTDNRTTAQAGDTLTYDILVSNVSNSDATDVTIVDDLPNDVDFVSASANGTYNAQSHTVTWVIDIDAQDTEALTVVVEVQNSVDGGDSIYNEVCIESGDCDDDTTTIEDDLQFSISKTDNRSTVQRGETLTYEIDVTNISSVDGHDVEIIDTLPQYVTFVSATDNGDFSNGTVTWTIDLDAGDTERLEVVVTVDNNAPDGFFLYNYVEITGGPDDDDTTKVVVDEEIMGCIDVKKETFTPNGSALTPVTQFTFHLDGGTQTVQNNSNGDARFSNVPAGVHTVTEIVPSGWTQFNVTPTNGTVTVPEGNNCVTVTFKNRQDFGGTTNFTISKTDNRTEADPGDTLTYEITVRNTGTVDATNVEVVDYVPSGTDYVSASDNASRSGDRITWTFDLAAGASKTLTLRVEVDDNADDGDVIHNNACVTNGPCDDDDTEIVVEDDDDDDDNGDLHVNIYDDPDPIDVCDDDDLEYEIRITNPNNSNEKTDVVAILDSNTDYISSSNGGRERSGDRVEWDNVSISRNSDRTLRLRVRVDSDTRDGDTLRLRVGLSNGDDDTEVTRVRSRDCGYNPPSGDPDLTIDKTADKTEALAGSLVSYTITIRNTSTEDVHNAVLTDDYPENELTISDPGGGSDAGGRLTWNLGTLRANSTTVVRYRSRLRQDVSRGTTIRNIATVRSGTITRTDDHVIVVPTPPQTGLGGFIKSLTRSDSYLSESKDADAVVAVRPQARDEETMIDAVPVAAGAATLPMVVWVTTMLTGLGMGGLFGRRFLF